MPAPSDLVHETSTTTGTGNLTLSNANGKRSFNTAFGTGGSNVFDYYISNRDAAEWERGTGSLLAASTLVRDTVIASSNANAAVNFSAGTKDVTNDVPAGNQPRLDAANNFTAANQFASIELGHASDTTLSRSAAGVLAVEGVIVKNVGKETIWVPAAAMTARTTNGAASGVTELATNDIMLRTFDFDQTTEEGVQFMIGMPKSWNESTVTFVPYWTAASGSGGVVWRVHGLAVSDDDAMDAAYGTGQDSTDTLLLANDCHIGPESSAITIAGTPAENDLVSFQVTRVVSHASDTLTADAKLIGIKLFVTTNAATDA